MARGNLHSADITVAVPAPHEDGRSHRRQTGKYGGRRPTWPGAVALVLLVLGAVAGLTYWGIQTHTDMLSRKPDEAELAKRYGSGTTITDGKVVLDEPEVPLNVSNPTEYADKKCLAINYLTKGKQIVARSNGVDTPVVFKGVNWLGMEGWEHRITGLWDGPRDGNTVYKIAKFLSDNKFNAVRIPLDVYSTAKNISITTNFNTQSMRALALVRRYVELLTRLAEGFGQFNIAVVFAFNTRSKLDLRADDHSVIEFSQRVSSEGELGNGWENPNVRLQDYQDAVQALATAMCDARHWNVVGIDVKDAPQGSDGTWAGDSKTSWLEFATNVGNTVVKACPNWLVFAQGLSGKTSWGTGAATKTTVDWPGATLKEAATKPIKLAKPNKVVYAPPFWSPSIKLKTYFYKALDEAKEGVPYTEFPDMASLQASVDAAMKGMFGDVFGAAPMILSSFGGLYGTEDKHPLQTSTRALDAVMKHMTSGKTELSGGFWWSLNPDNVWPFFKPNINGTAPAALSGLLQPSWRAANEDQLKATAKMDAMPNLAPLPCDARDD